MQIRPRPLTRDWMDVTS